MDGNVKASYNAFAIYQRMPVTAAPVQLSGVGFGALASSNATRTSMVLWSTVEATIYISANMLDVPFSHGLLSVYRIDESHCSYGNTRDPKTAALAPVAV